MVQQKTALTVGDVLPLDNAPTSFCGKQAEAEVDISGPPQHMRRLRRRGSSRRLGCPTDGQKKKISKSETDKSERASEVEYGNATNAQSHVNVETGELVSRGGGQRADETVVQTRAPNCRAARARAGITGNTIVNFLTLRRRG